MHTTSLLGRGRLFVYVTSLALGSVLGMNHAWADEPDRTQTPTFGSVTLKAGFSPDPFTKTLTAGGSIKTKLGGVNAHISKAPDFKLHYTAGSAPLRISVESKGDTTLLVNLPNGTWVANDDGGVGNNPQLSFAQPQSGRYDIWVGTFGEKSVAATLHISEMSATPSGGGSGIATHYGNTWRKISREMCTTKALEAMAIKENFISVEADKGGTVFGATENAACVVWSYPVRDGVEIYTFVAGKDGKEVERLRNNIRAHVCDGPYKPNIKLPVRDPKRRIAAPTIHLGFDSRNMTFTDFSTAGSLSMDRLGFKPNVDTKAFTISGYKSDASAIAFYLPTKPGTGQMSIISASYNSHLAEYLRNTIRIETFEKWAPKPYAVILCKYSDKPNYEPHPLKFYQEAFTLAGKGMGREYDYIRQVSHGALDMTNTTVFGWYTMKNHTYKDMLALKSPDPGRSIMVDWAIETAKANNANVKSYHGVIAIFNGNAHAGATGNHRIVLGYPADEWNPAFNMHEILHGYDLEHSYSARPDVVYGDRWDIMSALNCWTTTTKWGGGGPGMNAYNLKKAGGLPSYRIATVPRKIGTTTTITLASLHRREAEGSLMAQIPPVLGSTTSYTVEFRQKKGWDAGIPADTLLIHEVRSNGLCYLLSRTDKHDADSVQVTAGQEFSFPGGKFSVKALSFNDGAANAKVSITITK